MQFAPAEWATARPAGRSMPHRLASSRRDLIPLPIHFITHFFTISISA